MENFKKLRITVGILLIISAITHVMQLIVYGVEGHVFGASIFGIAYFILGILLVKYQESKPLSIIGAILPAIGGTLGIGRLILFYILESGEINFFIVFHVVVDVIVIPSCIYVYYKLKKS